MRLINADNIHNAGDFVVLHEDGNAYISLDNLCKLIDIQPTAYNMDEVIKKLKNNCFNVIRYADNVIDINEAINIVKGGVINA